LIKELAVGNTIFPVNLIQGPLAGVSCAPFRYLTWKHSAPAFSCTEMISCKTLIHHTKKAYQRFVAKDPREGPVSFQLSANNPAELAVATKIVTDCGANMIDLNCGCPVKKIRSKGVGSSLLLDAAKIYQLILAMKQNTSVPVSIKIRVEGDSSEKFMAPLAQAVSDAGADFLVVHGRHWTEKYDVPCRHDQIQYFVEQLKIPVIGNGDVACLASLDKMLATGCAGVMIGRAGVGQPWLIRKLIAEKRQENFTPPSFAQIGEIFIEHVHLLTDLFKNEKFALIQVRKLAKYYARGRTDWLQFYTATNTCDNLADFTKICQDYFH